MSDIYAINDLSREKIGEIDLRSYPPLTALPLWGISAASDMNADQAVFDN